MTQLAGSITIDLNFGRIADALGERVAAKVSEQLRVELEPYGGQGAYAEPVQPPWSSFCHTGEHERCQGAALPFPRCHCTVCQHHGEPAGSAVYERTDQVGTANLAEVAGGFRVGKDVDPDDLPGGAL